MIKALWGNGALTIVNVVGAKDLLVANFLVVDQIRMVTISSGFEVTRRRSAVGSTVPKTLIAVAGATKFIQMRTIFLFVTADKSDGRGTGGGEDNFGTGEHF